MTVYSPCGSTTESVFSNNLVGSANIGYFFQDINSLCIEGKDVVTYSCQVSAYGLSNHTLSLTYRNIYSIDSKLGLSLKFFYKGNDQTAYVEDSYFSVTELIRKCPICLSYAFEQVINIDCSNMSAISLPVVMEYDRNWRSFFYSSYSSSILDYTYQSALDSKAFIKNVHFKNYRTTGNYENTDVRCRDNTVFTTSASALELIGSMHISSSSCQNC